MKGNAGRTQSMYEKKTASVFLSCASVEMNNKVIINLKS